MKELYEQRIREQKEAEERQAGGATAIYMQQAPQAPVVEVAEVVPTAEDESKKRKYVEEEETEEDKEQGPEFKVRKG
jgi:hypothetical protein